MCGGLCVEPKADRKHCGKCDQACGDGTICKNGSCVFCPYDQPSRCGNTCASVMEDNKHCGKCDNACSKTLTCQAGRCVCAHESQSCSEGCVFLDFNPKHCGKCENKCKDTERCYLGSCIPGKCPKEAKDCGRGCVNVNNNPRHCGACGKTCRFDQVCINGRCACPPGLLECDKRCTLTSVDWNHCGGCGKRCGDGKYCINGQCHSTCPKATPAKCFGGCFNTQNNTLHCGKCGQSCPPGTRCSKGSCLCANGLTQCGSRCLDLNTDAQNCGGCHRVCSAGQKCAGGKCVGSCPKDTPNACGNGCYNFQTDSRHCGGCGKKCLGGESCIQGSCRCAGNLVSCNGVCVDTKSHWGHCGGCGRKCSPTQLCLAGVCKDATSCPKASQRVCRGGCVDIQSSVLHCGGCEVTCSQGESCLQGLCQTSSASERPQETPSPETMPMDGGAHETSPESREMGPERTSEVLPETAPETTKPDSSGACTTDCGWMQHFGAQGVTLKMGDGVLWKDTKSNSEYLFITGAFSKDFQIPKAALEFPSNTQSYNLSTKGNRSTFVVKYNLSKMKFSWASSIVSNGANQGRGIAVAGDGTSYVTGGYQGTLDSRLAKKTDLFVAKIPSSGGSPTWYALGGGSENDEGTHVAVDHNDTLYVTGLFGSADLTFHDSVSRPALRANQHQRDIFFVKCKPLNGKKYVVGSPRKVGGSEEDDEMSGMVTLPGNDNTFAIALSGTFGGTKTTRGKRVGFTQNADPIKPPLIQSIGVTVMGTQTNSSLWNRNSNEHNTLFGANTHKSWGGPIAVLPGKYMPAIYAMGSYETSFSWRLPSPPLKQIAKHRYFFLSKIVSDVTKKPIISTIARFPVYHPGSSLTVASMVVQKASTSENVYFTGNFTGRLFIGNDKLESKNNTIFIAKKEAGKNHIATSQLDCTASCTAQKILFDEKGAVYLLGTYTGSISYKSKQFPKLKLTSWAGKDEQVFIWKLPKQW